MANRTQSVSDGVVAKLPLQAAVLVEIGNVVVIGDQTLATGVKGHIKEAAATAGHYVVGVALNTVDNSDGLAGAVSCEVAIGMRAVRMTINTGSLSADDIGRDAYVSGTDGDTFATSGTHKIGRIIGIVAGSTTEAYVKVDPISEQPTADTVDSLAAAGTAQGDAADISDDVTIATGADGVKGVKLPTAAAGLSYKVYNSGAAALLLYPNTSDDINDGTADAAVSVPPKSVAECYAVDATTWAVQITALPNLPVTLAATGSDLAGAAQIVAHVTFVTAADGAKGVKLPVALPGEKRVVYNSGTANLLIYPASGDDINDQTASEPVAIGPKASIEFTALDTSTWVHNGYIATAQEVTPDDSESALNTVLPNSTSVDVQAVTNDANDFIVLPALADVPNGHTITILCNAGGNFEMRTPASSNEEINSEDCDGTKEYLCTDTEVVKVVKINNTIGWMAHAFSAIGAVVTAVVPD